MNANRKSCARAVRTHRCAITIASATAVALAGATADAAQGSRYRDAVTSPSGVIAGMSAQATQVGMRILDNGGNAIDAAVATAFAEGVTRPDACGIGGHGAMLYRPKDGRVVALDFYSTSPLATTPGKLVGPLYKRNVGHLAVGVPGVVAGLDAAFQRYGSGKFTWSDLVMPAEVLAATGVTVTWSLATSMFDKGAPGYALGDTSMLYFPQAAATYTIAGAPYPPGSQLLQTEYALSLDKIRMQGPRAMYTGDIMKAIVADMQTGTIVPLASANTDDPLASSASVYLDKGLLTAQDFAAYRPVWRTPAQIDYRGHTIYAMPAPSAGGVESLIMLNILKGFDLAAYGESSANTLHLTAEAEKLAWADRYWISDPAFVPDYTQTLTSDHYANQRRTRIDMSRAQFDDEPGNLAGSGASVAGVKSATKWGGHTCHISVIDGAGNAVSLTWTIGQEFGSLVMAPGTGFVLNDEIAFDDDPYAADYYGAGKRPNTQSMPMLIERDGRLEMVIGAAGGAWIRSGVVRTVLNYIDFHEDAAHAVDTERVHAVDFAIPSEYKSQPHYPLMIESSRVPAATLLDLKARGHRIACGHEYNSFPVVSLAAVNEDGSRSAVTDPRNEWGACAQGLPCPASPADFIGRLQPDVEEGVTGDPSPAPDGVCIPQG